MRAESFKWGSIHGVLAPQPNHTCYAIASVFTPTRKTHDALVTLGDSGRVRITEIVSGGMGSPLRVEHAALE